MRLLLAEDNRELAHWLEKALVQNGFAVDSVNDGRAADHLLQAIAADIFGLLIDP